MAESVGEAHGGAAVHTRAARAPSRCTPRSASSRASRRRCTGAVGRWATCTSPSCPMASGRVAGGVRAQPGHGALVVEVSGPAGHGAASPPGRADPLARRRRPRAFPKVGERDPADRGACRQRYPGLRPVQFPFSFEAGAVVRPRPARAGGAGRRRSRARITRGLGETRRDLRGTRTPRRSPRRDGWPSSKGLAGLPERKLATLRELAQGGRSRAKLDGERTARAMGGEAAVEELQRLPGVGPFTAQGIVVRGAGEPDHLADRRAAHGAGGGARLRPGRAARRPDGWLRCGEAWRPYRSWVEPAAAFGFAGQRRTRRARTSRCTGAAASEEARAGADGRSSARGVRARYPRPCKPDSRGGADSPSRKVRTPEGKVVGRPTRGNPRESATETHRRWRSPCRAPHRQG